MSNLETKIKNLTNDIKEEMEMQKAIIKLISSLDMNVRCSAINNEFLYNSAELEFIFKVRVGKKEEFLKFLDFNDCHCNVINGTKFWSLFSILETIQDAKSAIRLTHYWNEEKANA